MLSLNPIDWDVCDLNNKFTIHTYGKSEDNKTIGLRINNFKPDFYIRIIDDKNSDIYMNKLTLTNLKQNFEIITRTHLYCSKFNSNNEDEDEDEESDEESEEDTKKCNCLSCNPIEITKYNDNNFNFGDSNIFSVTFESKKDLYDGFNYDYKNKTSSKFYNFIHIKFNNLKSFNKFKNNFKKEIFHPLVNKKVDNKYITIDNCPLSHSELYINYYESSMPPLLRFFHIKNIQPMGWIQVEHDKISNIDNYFNCDESYNVNYNDIIALDKVNFANFKIMSWDIEADSEYGDFPKAIKDYKKQGAEIADFYLEKINSKEDVTKEHFDNILRIMFDLPTNGLDIDLNKYNINKIYFKKDIKEILNHKNNYIKHILNLSKKIYEICIENKEYTTYKNNSIFDNWIKKDKSTKYNNDNDSDDYSDDCVSDNEYNEENDDILNELKTNRDIIIHKINKLFTEKIGLYVRGDRITQIGAVFYNYGTTDCYDRYIITLGSCDSYNEECIIIKTKKEDNNKFLNSKKVIENASKETTDKIKIIPYYKTEIYDNYDNVSLDKSEKQLILTFKELILKQNPDIIVAFNNFGFDNPYLIDRCKELNILSTKCFNRQCHNIGTKYQSNCKEKLYCETCSRCGMKTIKSKDTFNISRLLNDCTTLDIKVLSSSALGDNTLHLINSKGIVHIDLLAVVKRDHNLESYKLDFIAEKFLNEHKDDVSAKQIFEYQKKDGYHRGIVAKYCVQDCVLLLNLMKKLDICASNMGMANVSSIPLSFIFLRGQGIKIQSLFGNFCMKEDVLLKTLEKKYSDESYEGAVVLEPVTGMYLKDDEKIPVLDYASLYPSSMIGANISHDSIVDIEDTNYKKLSEIKNLKFTNMRDGFTFLNIEKYIKDELLIEKIINRNKVYPLYDSIWIPEIKKRYIRFENIYKLYDQKRDNPKNNDNLNIPDYNYTVIYFYTYRGKGDKKYCTGIRKVTFANPLDEEKIGIVPKILKKVLKKRKDVRKLIPNEPDVFKKGVYEGLQLAYKQSANSLYGQTGSSVSCISDINLASATTATGRLMLDLCKTFSEQYYKAKVVYGDSVTGDEPLILKNKEGLIEIKTIETLSNEWEPYENFKPNDTISSNRRNKQKSFVNYEVFANNKWNPIKKVIRHKTNKKIYRVNTHCGVVDVTEDHSLLNEQGEKIKPNECIINKTKLLQSFPKFNEKPLHLNEIVNILNKYENYERNFEEQLSFLYGMFYGDGSCGIYNCKSGIKYSWAINNQNRRLLEMCKNYLKNVFNDYDFKILETMESSSVLKLVPKGKIKLLVNSFRELFYDKDKNKIVPNNIINGNKQIRLNFFLGYYFADGYKCYNTKNKNICFSNKGKIGSCQLYYICKSLGYKCSLSIRNDKPNIYKITCTVGKQRKETNILKKMLYLRDSEEEFVYDLETENGNFNTGVGEITVKNTDSIFCCYDKSVFSSKKNNDNNLLELLNEHLDKPINYENNDKLTLEIKDLIENMNKVEGEMSLKISILRSIVLSNEIAELLRPPHDLEYEKTFAPFILFSKKRYVGTLYELDPGKGKLKYMGIVLKRRDNAKIVKDIYGGIINKIIEDRSVESSIKFLQDKLVDLTEGKIPIEDLTVTKTLRGHYKNRSMIAHAVLADRIADRTGEKVASNTRMAYVYVEVPEKRGVKILQGNRIDTPEYIKENNLKIDYKFYITNQLSKPILQIYDLEMQNPSSVFTDILRKCENKKSNNTEITKWFKPQSEVVTPIIIKKGCIYQIQKGKTTKKKCNHDVVHNSNYCLKHYKIMNK